jgi:acyl carrier protein
MRSDSGPQLSANEEAAMHNDLVVKVREIIAGHFGINPDGLTDDARFRDDLGADWLDRLEVMIAIEDQISGFELADVVADQIDTIGDLMRIIDCREGMVSLPLSAPKDEASSVIESPAPPT